MLEIYRHGGRHGAFGGHTPHHHHSTAIQPHRAVSSFGALGDWTDALMPRSTSSSPTSSFNVWELSPNKLRTAAVAFTFVVTAGYISLLAAGGLLAILVTGAVVTCCVLLTVLTCATLITLIVTGVPVGYAIIRLVLAARSSGGGSKTQSYGGGGFGASAAPGLFSGLFSGGQNRQQQQHEDDDEVDHQQGSAAAAAAGGGGGGFSSRTYGGSGWRFRTEGDEDADEQ